MRDMAESVVEEAALEWLSGMGLATANGPDLAHDGAAPERQSYADVVLVERLCMALANINPTIPPDAIEDAIRKLLRPESPTLVENNERFHRFACEGIDVEYRRPDGSVKGDKGMAL